VKKLFEKVKEKKDLKNAYVRTTLLLYEYMHGDSSPGRGKIDLHSLVRNYGGPGKI
jgi:hypothetical protein